MRRRFTRRPNNLLSRRRCVALRFRFRVTSLKGKPETILTQLGYELAPVADSHICCGSAGTYSLLQPELSRRLLENKIAALTAGAPTAILTANIGCQAHLQTATGLPVRHWIEALDEALSGPLAPPAVAGTRGTLP